jgi:hypothetical protein
MGKGILVHSAEAPTREVSSLMRNILRGFDTLIDDMRFQIDHVREFQFGGDD